jgi:hypothetical protein
MATYLAIVPQAGLVLDYMLAFLYRICIAILSFASRLWCWQAFCGNFTIALCPEFLPRTVSGFQMPCLVGDLAATAVEHGFAADPPVRSQ